MDKLRMRFSKRGRSVYISHLDLMHTFQRAFFRAGYTLRYSEGFNPHPVISIAMPLSVGTSSDCEILDFRLADERNASHEILTEMSACLNSVLPEGIEVRRIYEPLRKISEIKWLECEGKLEYDSGADTDALKEFYIRSEIVITKRTKSGTAYIDIMSGMKKIMLSHSEDEKIVTIRAVVSAQDPVLNPELLVEALRQHIPELVPDHYTFNRIEIYDALMKGFF